ncbi:hypothetical protein [Croceicoccus bisphenolivorans]|uniref:hypothetical protein n=1 Tax=Croceicoccus bisphenolivorans TaxID=1783232 RepID=UPI00082DAFAE|nr:hypothetical protein [Croceicoccus bisphenolivorans]
MPNMKIFADQAMGTETIKALHAALPAMRALLCDRLAVPLDLAQLAIVPVSGLADQAQFAVEMQILPKPERTRESIVAACEELRMVLRGIADVKVAVRVTTVDPVNYLVMR